MKIKIVKIKSQFDKVTLVPILIFLFVAIIVHIFSLADPTYSGFLNSATNDFDRRFYDDWFMEKIAKNVEKSNFHTFLPLGHGAKNLEEDGLEALPMHEQQSTLFEKPIFSPIH